jgi:N-acetyl-gamma-glutamyl-phosphate reductase
VNVADMTDTSIKAGALDRGNPDALIRVAVVGATGYAGRELITILARHPKVQVTSLMSSGRHTAGAFPIEKSHPVLRHSVRAAGGATVCQPLNTDDLTASELDVVFLTTPHETSHQIVPLLLHRGLRLIDLSGAFRLKEAASYGRWYGFEHHAAEALEQAVYGLPDLNPEAISTARLVSNPGCYATSIILALAPLLRAGWIDLRAGIVCDSKSGASGAGRAPSDKLQFVEVNENCRAYGLFTHRHVPEMLQALELEESRFTFTPHLLPITRGILSTIYVRLNSSAPADENAIHSLYEEFYSSSPLVRIYEKQVLPEIQAITHTNYADLGFVVEPGSRRLVIVSALDNLGKGAAGQAVENMNLMCGFPRQMALA